MTVTRALLIGIGCCAGVLMLARGWRPGLGALAGVALAIAGFVRVEALSVQAVAVSQGQVVLTGIEMTTAVSVVLILLLSCLAYGRERNGGHSDQVGLQELRQASDPAAGPEPATNGGDYLLPSLALVLLLAATALVPQLYPFPVRDVAYAWTLLLLGGILLLVTAATVLTVGFGLVLLLYGLKLLYLSTVPRIGLAELTLFNLATIVMALMGAYLTQLLSTGLKTLSLAALFADD